MSQPSTDFLFGDAVEQRLKEYCSSATSNVTLISAYVTEKAFSSIARSLENGSQVNKILVTRWQKRDLVTGASSLGVYLQAKSLGWKVYIQASLHAKVYVVDDNTILGSANLTASGLNMPGGFDNVEACIATRFDEEMSVWVRGLIAQAAELDDELFEQISREVELCSPNEDTIGVFSQDVVRAINQSKIQRGLYTKDLFWLSDPGALLDKTITEVRSIEQKHDLVLLGLEPHPSHSSLRAHFLSSPGWLWLSRVASNPKYYGELTESLHAVLLDDPAVYRKDVKELLSNLLCWSELLCPERCNFDKPNYSQRVQIY